MAKYNPNRPFEDLFNFHTFEETRGSHYPPYNLYQDKDNWIIEVALAGFKKGDLYVEIEPKTHRLGQRTLVVKANRPKPESEVEYSVRGIALRNFKLSFNLDDEAEIRDARFEDGLLTICISSNVRSTEKEPIPVPIS